MHTVDSVGNKSRVTSFVPLLMFWEKYMGGGEVEIETEKKREKRRTNTELRDMKHLGQGQGLGRVRCSVEGKLSSSSLILPCTHTLDLRWLQATTCPRKCSPEDSYAIDCFHKFFFFFLSNPKCQALKLLNSAEKKQSWLSPKVVDLTVYLMP